MLQAQRVAVMGPWPAQQPHWDGAQLHSGGRREARQNSERLHCGEAD